MPYRSTETDKRLTTSMGACTCSDALYHISPAAAGCHELHEAEMQALAGASDDSELFAGRTEV